MARRLLPLIASVALAGCPGISENTFVVDWEEGFCDAYMTCATDEMKQSVGLRECHEDLRSTEYPEPPDCLYDAVAAEACIAEIEAIGCEGVDPALPEVCTEVYSGCPYPRLPAVGDNRRI